MNNLSNLLVSSFRINLAIIRDFFILASNISLFIHNTRDEILSKLVSSY
jgi:hypothetical protein